MKLLYTLTTLAMIAVASLAAIGAGASAVDHQWPNVIFDAVVVVVLSIFAWANWQDVKKPPTAPKLTDQNREP